MQGTHRLAPKSTSRGMGAVAASAASAAVANIAAPQAQPAGAERRALVDTHTMQSRASTAPMSAFLNRGFIVVDTYASISLSSSGEGTRPLTFTTPSTTSAGVIITPNAMIF